MTNKNDDDTNNDSDGKMSTATTKTMTTTTNELISCCDNDKTNANIQTCIPTYNYTLIVADLTSMVSPKCNGVVLPHPLQCMGDFFENGVLCQNIQVSCHACIATEEIIA